VGLVKNDWTVNVDVLDVGVMELEAEVDEKNGGAVVEYGGL
jgi:hypothetical protein